MTLTGAYKIFDDGEMVGEMTVYAQGMMTVFEGTCKPDREGPFRVAALSGGYLILLGVMLPTEDGYYIRRSFSKNAMAQLGIREISEFRLIYPDGEENQDDEKTSIPDETVQGNGWQDAPEPWRLFKDQELSEVCRQVKGAKMRREEDGDISLAIPLERYAPFPAMPIFCFGTYEKIQNKSYVLFRLRDGVLIQ